VRPLRTKYQIRSVTPGLANGSNPQSAAAFNCRRVGYLPIDRQGANLFFQLVSRCYERGSIIITSNQSLGAWGEVFGDTVIASAILDRLPASFDRDQYQRRKLLPQGKA
jgi:hypothetical protein